MLTFMTRVKNFAKIISLTIICEICENLDLQNLSAIQHYKEAQPYWGMVVHYCLLPVCVVV